MPPSYSCRSYPSSSRRLVDVRKLLGDVAHLDPAFSACHAASFGPPLDFLRLLPGLRHVEKIGVCRR